MYVHVDCTCTCKYKCPIHALLWPYSGCGEVCTYCPGVSGKPTQQSHGNKPLPLHRRPGDGRGGRGVGDGDGGGGEGGGYDHAPPQSPPRGEVPAGAVSLSSFVQELHSPLPASFTHCVRRRSVKLSL